MILVGLTGSIGMGKSTVSMMFAKEGAAVWNADDAVHRLYAKGGAAAPLIEAAFPSAVVDGAVDRTRLANLVLGAPDSLRRLEDIVHPLVADDRQACIEKAIEEGVEILVLDIPLLFENNAAELFHVVVVVSASPETQRARVLGRPGMDEEKFNAILAAQMPDEEKRRYADYVINTDRPLEETQAEVASVVEEIRRKFGVGEEGDGPWAH